MRRSFAAGKAQRSLCRPVLNLSVPGTRAPCRKLLSTTPRHQPLADSAFYLTRPTRFYCPQRTILSTCKRAYTTTDELTPLRSGVDPVSILVVIALTSVTGYLISEYVYPPDLPPSPTEEHTETKQTRVVEVRIRQTSPDLINPEDMASIPEGRPGNLTPEQEIKLKELWSQLFEVTGVIPSEKFTFHRVNSGQSSAASSPDLSNAKRKSRLSWFSRGSNNSEKAPEFDVAGLDGEDKHGLNKEFKKALSTHSSEEMHTAFWTCVKNDDPDGLLLRFLRARKWVVQDALVMLISSLSWRSFEMNVDEGILYKGERGFIKQSVTGKGTDKQDATDFIAQLKVGKSVIHGKDRENRPVTIVRVRQHFGGKETEKSLEQYTVYMIETSRLALQAPVDTATIIFDMTGFTMSNMDYKPVKFMIKCFEANYPESLGAVVIYHAPWIFQGIWKIIRGWLDPVVATKIHFASDIDELSTYVDRKGLPKEVGGDEDWEYNYTEPPDDNDKRITDDKTREEITSQRRALADKYQKATLAWIKEGSEANVAERRSLVEQLKDNYWKLDPYVRARSFYDRIGFLNEGGRINFYPGRGDATSTTAGTAGSTAPSAAANGSIENGVAGLKVE